MSDADRLLELIEEGIVEHGGDLGGWTRRGENELQLFDGRVTLRAEVDEDEDADSEAVHAHVLTTLHEHDDEVLDACLFGIGQDREAGLSEAALIWITCVAGPIKSFADGKPICMTCQAGVQGGDVSEGYSPGDYGMPGLRAYVGPSISRGFNDERIQASFDDTKPWFRYAAESAAPRRVHLAKSTVVSNGKDGWRRELEIDGHDVSHHDPDWPATIAAPEFGYMTRFAVFEFPRNSTQVARRAELEKTIEHFADNFSKFETSDDLISDMIGQGFDEEVVHEVESISTIAFGRAFFEPHGAQYPSTIIRARRDGRVETDVPLMSLPAYSRARALAARFGEMLPEDDIQLLCFYNAESQAILQALESTDEELDLGQITMYPCVVPELGVSDDTMDAAMATLRELVDRNSAAKKKAWWKFW